MVTVSETAAAVGGSSAFLDAGSSYKVSDLIKTVIIASANDSCVALAEHIAGSEDVFVARMNKLAKISDLKIQILKMQQGFQIKSIIQQLMTWQKFIRTVLQP